MQPAEQLIASAGYRAIANADRRCKPGRPGSPAPSRFAEVVKRRDPLPSTTVRLECHA